MNTHTNTNRLKNKNAFFKGERYSDHSTQLNLITLEALSSRKQGDDWLNIRGMGGVGGLQGRKSFKK